MQDVAKAISVAKGLAKGLLLAPPVIALLVSLPVTAQNVSPNIARGFDAEKAYSVDDVDATNLFNGNLNVSIPLGRPYSVGPALSYQFALNYGGNSWEYDTRDYEIPNSDHQYITYGWGFPSRRDNAGVGWRLHFGRMWGGGAQSDLCSGLSYESPDGADHAFYPAHHPQNLVYPNGARTCYTWDGTYLRVQAVGDDWELEFPDGEIHTFKVRDPLQGAVPSPVMEIRDRFGHWVRFDYATNGASAAPAWTITDSELRTHYVDFKVSPPYREFAAMPGEVTHYQIAQVRLVQGTSLVTYKLHYFGENVDWATIPYPRPDETAIDPEIGRTIKVPLLQSVNLPNGSFELDYDRTGTDCFLCGGTLLKLQYPTGGRIEWRYETATFPENTIAPWSRKFGAHYFDSAAVRERKLLDADGALVGRRTYARQLGGAPAADIPPTEQRVVETDFRGDGAILSKSEHFFSVCPTQCTAPVVRGDYGLPITKRPGADPPRSDGAGHYLSRIDYRSADDWTRKARTTYLAYESDAPAFTSTRGGVITYSGGDLNRRVISQRVVFNEDPSDPLSSSSPPHYTDSTYSDFDGLGHYRKTEISGSFGKTKGTTTNYNPERGTFPGTFVMLPNTDPWITETYTSVEVEQDGEVGRSEFCFNPLNGFLSRKRVKRTPQQARFDLLTVFRDNDANGFVDVEESFGGDKTPLPEPFDTCTGTPGSPAFVKNYAYQNGVLSSSQYAGMPFKSFDVDVDLSGNVTASRDPSGLETRYDYDAAGRLENVHPPGAAWTQYRYELSPDSKRGATVSIFTHAKDDASGSENLTESHHYYDNFGRRLQTRTKVPPMKDGEEWSITGLEYDELGRQKSTFVPSAATSGNYEEAAASVKETVTTYDELGRVKTITQPDGGVATVEYTGARVTTRSAKVQITPQDQKLVSVRETRDQHGRLVEVAEGITAGNANGEITTYEYDEGDRLSHVVAGVQERTFDYDGAGLLVSEHHPESGVTGFEYDARGHVTKKTAANATSLVFTYDAAERVTRMTDQAGRDLKTFFFGSPSTGRLQSQTRKNYLEGFMEPYVVTDAFLYKSDTGLVKSKTTTIRDTNNQSVAFEQKYDYTELGQPDKRHFPICSGCGTIDGNIDREIDLEYQSGVLTSIAGVTKPIGATGRGIIYTPAGQTYQALHANGVLDTVCPDPTGMARPSRIQFSNARDCDLIMTQPSDAPLNEGRATFTIATVPNATAVWYEGSRGDTSKPTGVTGSTFVTPVLDRDTYYWASVSTGSGCVAKSNTVAARLCSALQITSPATDFVGDPLPRAEAGEAGAIPVTITAVGSNLTYQWYQVTNGGMPEFIGSNAPSINWILTAGATEKTVALYVTVTGAGTGCGSGSATRLVRKVTVGPPPTREVCKAPKIISDLPGEVEINSGHFTPMLKPAIEPWDPTLPAGQSPLGLENDAHLEYRWYVDGVQLRYSNGSPFNPPAYQPGKAGVSVFAEVWRKCVPPYVPVDPPYEEKSVAVRTKAAFVYDRVHCTLPPVTIDQLSLEQSQTAPKTIHAISAWPTLKYQWYRGDSGNTRRKLVGATSPNYTPSFAAGVYWVRVTSTCGSVWDSPTIVVTAGSCSPVQIVRHPESASVSAKIPHTLSIDTVPAVNAVDWYRVDSSNGSNDVYVGHGQTVTIERPTKTAQYWAHASTGCHSNDSKFATLHVTSCDDISILHQPQSVSVVEHQSTTLTISAQSEFALSYEWYEGESGDISSGIKATTPSLTVSDAAITKNYWVRVKVANGCEVDSSTAEVYVCRTPVIPQTAQYYTSLIPGQYQWLDAYATGDNLSYQWYRGPVGDTVASVKVFDKLRSVLVAPGTTTTYWFRVTNDCREGTADRYADSPAILVSVCPIITEPAAAQFSEVMPNTAATLTVGASGSTEIRWYRGNSGEVQAQPAGYGATFHPIITEPSNFWAQVQGGTCERQSESVAVGPCTQPTIGWFQVRPQVASGEPQILAISGTVNDQWDRTYTWYRGISGDVAGSTVINSGTVQHDVAPTVTTSYWVRASQSNGCYADTHTLTVSVCVPTIIAQPQSAFIDKINNPGATATLSVGTTGEGLSYQWFKGPSGDTSNALTGLTTPTITVSPDVTTQYWVYVSGCQSPKSSTAATVTVCAKPQIAQHPLGAVATSSTTHLTVVANGTDLTYQWYVGLSGDTSTSTPITTNGTSASLDVSPSLTTDYWVKVSGRCGPSVSSNSAKVSVTPVITTQPAGGFVMPNTTRTLTVVASGSQLAYQWFAGTTPISGANGPSFTTPPVTADVTYMVRVTSGLALVESEPVVLTVCTLPTIGWQAPKTQITTGEPQTLRVVGTASGNYQIRQDWYIGNSGDVAGSTLINSGMVVQVQIAPAVTTKYWVRSSESNGCYADTQTLTVQVCVPTITAQPQSVLLDKVSNPSATATLTVAAHGGPLTYQWYTGASGVTTSPLSGQTGSSLTVSPTVDTTYWVRVSGSCGVVRDSAAATVTVCKAPQIATQPPSVTKLPGTTVTLSVTASGTDLTYQWYAGVSGSGSAITGATTTSHPASGAYTTDYWVKVSGRCGSVNSNTAKVSVAPTISTHPVGGDVTKGVTRTLSVTANGLQLAYQWYSGASTLIAGATGPTYVTPAINADVTYWVRVWSGNAYVDSNTAVFTVCQPRTAVILSNPSISNAAVTLRADTAGSGESYEWYRGESGVTTALVGGGYQIIINPSGTTRYWVRTKRQDCDADSPAITVTVCTPSISAQPQSSLIMTGSTKTLSVTATGTTPLGYQWYVGNSGVTTSPIANATAASYTTPALTATTKYWVQVRNLSDSSCGAAGLTNSVTATVTVCQPPVITAQPQNCILENSSSSTTLSVTATGDGLTYQWYAGTTGVTTQPVGTGASLVVTPGWTKYYWVRITGACGTVDSNALLASVKPTIYSVTPVNLSVVCDKSLITATVNAGGTALTYQWFKAGPNDTQWQLFGTTATATTIINGDTAFKCTVTSGNASVSSWPQNVSVIPSPVLGTTYKSCSGGWCQLTANVDTNDMSTASYAWYQGPLGNTSTPVGSDQMTLWVPSSPSRTYWVRVTNTENGCSSDAGPVTVP